MGFQAFIVPYGSILLKYAVGYVFERSEEQGEVQGT
jgi:hypothetical protein